MKNKEICYKRKNGPVEIYVTKKGRMFLNFIDNKSQKVIQSEHISDDVAEDLIKAERLKKRKC